MPDERSRPEGCGFADLLAEARRLEAEDRPEAEVLAAYDAASAADPARAESLYGAARYCRYKAHNGRGYDYATRAFALLDRSGPDGPDRWIHDYGIFDELAVLAFWVGAFAQCADLCDRLLHEGKLPAHMRERVAANRQFALDKLPPEDDRGRRVDALALRMASGARPAPRLESDRVGFNICFVTFNEHDRLYDDATRPLVHALADLGHDCTLSENELTPGRVNILVGNMVYPAVDAARMRFLGDRPFVLHQVEQLPVLATLPVAKGYRELVERAAAILEFSPSGAALLRAGPAAARTHLLPMAFHRCMEVTRPARSPDIDVLFYGSHCERRTQVMDALRAGGANAVHLFDVYGEALWDHIRRARIVVNIHYREAFNSLETVRLVPLLANRCFVVSETSDHDPFDGAVVFADHARLAETCLSYLRERAGERDARAAAGYLAVRRLDLVTSLAEVLGALDLDRLVA